MDMKNYALYADKHRWEDTMTYAVAINEFNYVKRHFYPYGGMVDCDEPYGSRTSIRLFNPNFLVVRTYVNYSHI
jgi:hypothetical protein